MKIQNVFVYYCIITALFIATVVFAHHQLIVAFIIFCNFFTTIFIVSAIFYKQKEYNAEKEVYLKHYKVLVIDLRNNLLEMQTLNSKLRNELSTVSVDNV